MRSLLTATAAAVLLSSAFSLPAAAKDLAPSDVPAAVRQLVESSYPNVSRTEWDFDKDDGYYEADLVRDGLEIEVKVSPEGKLIVAKEDVRAQDIPEAVRAGALKHYPNAKILGGDRFVRPSGIEWEVDMKLEDGRHRDVDFLPDGTPLHR